MYVSITGLELKSVLYTPKFMYYTAPAISQAKEAPGNIYAAARRYRGVYHTITVWEDRKFMSRYMASGNHAKAMKIFDDIATGKTYGYETDSSTPPSWEEMRELYDTKAKEVGKRTKRKEEKEGACLATDAQG